MYVENDPVSNRPALYSVPGQRAFLTVSTDHDARALFAMNDRVFAIVGMTLVELFSGGTYVVRGTVVQNANPAQMAMNGTTGTAANQLLIGSGNNIYSLALTTNVLTGPLIAGEAQHIGMLDGYGLALNPTTGKLRLSNLNDFTTWDSTQFALRSNQPDNWRAMVVNAPDLWLIGEQTGDVWYDAGTSPFPFAPRPGATFRYGILAVFTLIVLGDSVFWLSRNADGQGQVVQARGYVPQPINSYALSAAISRYEQTTTVSDAEAIGCELNGHLFYVLTFPSVPASWAYDVRTGLWAEWGQWNTATNRYDRWFPRVMCQTWNKHLIGGTGSGVIAQFDDTIATELDGGVIRRVRIPPALQAADRARLTIDRFELGVDTGVGTVSGQGSNPKVSLRVSRDFGHTWSNEREAALGKIGTFGTRCFWTRCGSSNVAWQPEIVCTDPVPYHLTGASILGSGFGAGF